MSMTAVIGAQWGDEGKGKIVDLLSKKVDFVGHLWCFKKDWLYYMFSIKPFTFDTGEDMHLCFTSK